MPYKEVDLNVVDWSKAAFPIGVACVGPQKPWLQLDYMDLKILEATLTRKIDGCAAAEGSQALQALADWCAVAIRWAEEKGIR